MVAENAPGHPIAPKGGHKPLFDRLVLLVGAGLKPNRKAGVVVYDRKRVAALSVNEGKVALEVHLPKLVGRLFLEALKRPVALLVLCLVGIEKPVALSDRLAGRGGRNRLGLEGPPVGVGLLAETCSNLATAPCRMPLAHLADRLGDRLGSLVRRVFRTARLLFEPLAALLAVATEPLVAGFSADVEPAAKGAHVGLFLVGKLYEFEFEGHLRSVVPGHGDLRFSEGKPSAGNVLPMSRNTC